MGSGNIYDLNDPDLQYFVINTKFDRETNNKNKIYSFLNDMNYNINYGDKKSMRYYFIKDLIEQYYQQSAAELSAELFTQIPNQVGSGLNGKLREATREAVHRATREAMQISTSSSHLIQTK